MRNWTGKVRTDMKSRSNKRRRQERPKTVNYDVTPSFNKYNIQLTLCDVRYITTSIFQSLSLTSIQICVNWKLAHYIHSVFHLCARRGQLIMIVRNTYKMFLAHEISISIVTYLWIKKNITVLAKMSFRATCGVASAKR